MIIDAVLGTLAVQSILKKRGLTKHNKKALKVKTT